MNNNRALGSEAENENSQIIDDEKIDENDIPLEKNELVIEPI